jgi:DNA-binding protein HU-beta
MRKADIVRRIAEATDLTQVQAEDVVDAIFDAMKSALQQGDSVILRRFGTFDVRDNAPPLWSLKKLSNFSQSSLKL